MGIQQNVANMMRAFKAERQKSTAEFSEELEISRSTLQEYLNGTGNPSVSMLEHIARKLGVDPMVLVSGSFPENRNHMVLLMFRTTKAVAELPEERRKLFCEAVSSDRVPLGRGDTMREKGARSGNTYEEAASAQSFRRPMMVAEIMFFRREKVYYPRCPRCGCTFEREYTAFCDRCGQRLDWKDFDSAMIWMR